MRVLQQLVKQGEFAQLAARAFGTSAAAAADVAVASAGSPFLRFSNPYPQSLDHTPLLSTIPDTQVRLSSCRVYTDMVAYSWQECSSQFLWSRVDVNTDASCCCQRDHDAMTSQLAGRRLAICIHVYLLWHA
jgi:processing peptidase subunit beta